MESLISQPKSLNVKPRTQLFSRFHAYIAAAVRRNLAQTWVTLGNISRVL